MFLKHHYVQNKHKLEIMKTQNIFRAEPRTTQTQYKLETTRKLKFNSQS